MSFDLCVFLFWDQIFAGTDVFFYLSMKNELKKNTTKPFREKIIKLEKMAGFTERCSGFFLF